MRIRTIKPEFWSSEGVASVSVPARLTFIGLWLMADDHGRSKANPKLVKSALWPLDSEMSADDVASHLQELETAGLIVRYEVDARIYLHVPSWEKHQAAAYRRGEPQYPAPPRVQKRAGREGNLEGNIEHRREGKGTGYSVEFLEFWEGYPRRQGKGAASEAFVKALLVAEASIVIAAAAAYAHDPNLPSDATKVPLPATWLNQRRWEDDPQPSSNGRLEGQGAKFLREAQQLAERGL